MVTVKKFNNTLTFAPDPKKPKKTVSLQGYSFHKQGNCLCIAYGETRRDEIKNLLNVCI